ncbi:MAG: response regulator transcription factor [Chloroflexi bacterium]|nr:response regulator transcription factor [Chloroflexota bacterium]
MTKILVVDDQPLLLDTLRRVLGTVGFEVQTADDGESALRLAREERPDLILLDVVLPTISGLEVCRILRKDSSVPILMLTAMDKEVDKVVGLEMGADDYLTKPFSVRELLARVKALLRRVEWGQPLEETAVSAEPVVVSRLRENGVEVDLVSRRTVRTGVPVDLKPKEFDLLAFLMHHRGQAFPPGQLLTEVWGYQDTSDTRTVVVHIRRLREKLENDPSQPKLIQTVRGVGYRFWQ